MSEAEWELITGEERHLPQISALSDAAFHTPFDVEHLRWRYFQHPLGNAPITLAYDTANDRIIGFYAGIPTQLQLGRDRIMGAQVIDTMVHPDYQGKGLFGKMGEHCFLEMARRGYQLIYGFPNKQAYGGCVNRLGWNHTGHIPLWVRPLHKAFHWLPTSKSERSINHEQPSIETLNELLGKATQPARTNSIARSGEWLHWRYDERGLRHFRSESLRSYQWHCLYNDNGALEALCVWGILDSGDATLCEIIGENEMHKATLLGEAIRQAQQKNLRAFRVYTQDKGLTKTLLQQAFLRLPKQLSAPLIVRHLSAQNAGGNVHNHSSWRIIGGDMDSQ